MGKQYFALNQIRHGEAGGEVTVFEPNEQVVGLSKEAMVSLWEAGVLREHDPSTVKRDDRDIEIERLRQQIESLEQEKKDNAETAKEQAERPVQEIPGMGGATPNTPEAAADMQGTVNDPPKEETPGGESK
jgi:hypothetical protein